MTEAHKDEVLDPAEAVLRQKKAGNGPKRQQQQLGAKGRDKEKTRGSQRGQQQHQQQEQQQNQKQQQQTNSFGMPSLEEVYTAIVQAKDQSLTEPNPGMELDDPLTLTSIYMDYTGPLLRQFLDGWIKATTAPGGYGSIVGKRSIGHLEVRRHNMLRNYILFLHRALGGVETQCQKKKSWHLIRPEFAQTNTEEPMANKQTSWRILTAR